MLLLTAMPYTFYIKILNSIGIIIEARKAVTITITVSPQIQIITGNGIEKYTRTFPSPIWTLTSSINLTIRRQPLPPSHIVQTGLKREPARSECIRDRGPSLKAYLSDILSRSYRLPASLSIALGPRSRTSSTSQIPPTSSYTLHALMK